MLNGAKRRTQSVTADWTILQDLIDGVRVKEIRSVIKNNGYLTEIYRADWQLDSRPVDQVFQVVLNPGEIEAWHVHSQTVDRFFVCQGRMKIVLYDAREESPTHGRINEFRLGSARSGIVSVPPGVWHGVQNIGDVASIMINLVDHAYVYEKPDHWGLPAGSALIPYCF
ncbi:MAG: dTDP-4-dehydrorhamnose 3,5-epimerase family protein [Chromatiales bacterium]|nr:dTDP-4-dehydrorhamnose 3,5-epimerase family protein [Chromatiales bacterium]